MTNHDPAYAYDPSLPRADAPDSCRWTSKVGGASLAEGATVPAGGAECKNAAGAVIATLSEGATVPAYATAQDTSAYPGAYPGVNPGAYPPGSGESPARRSGGSYPQRGDPAYPASPGPVPAQARRADGTFPQKGDPDYVAAPLGSKARIQTQAEAQAPARRLELSEPRVPRNAGLLLCMDLPLVCTELREGSDGTVATFTASFPKAFSLSGRLNRDVKYLADIRPATV